MARRLWVEVAGGLYHLIARGNESAKAMLAKEVLILLARERDCSVTELSLIAGLDTSNISRRHDAAREKLQIDRKLTYARDQVENIYLANIAGSQT